MLQLLGKPYVVAVQKSDIAARGGFYAHIPGSGRLSCRCCGMEQLYPAVLAAVPGSNRSTFVGGGVVYNKEFPVGIGLGQDRLHRLWER